MVTIKYKGETIDNLASGESIMLHTTDKKLTGDIEVIAPAESGGGSGGGKKVRIYVGFIGSKSTDDLSTMTVLHNDNPVFECYEYVQYFNVYVPSGTLRLEFSGGVFSVGSIEATYSASLVSVDESGATFNITEVYDADREEYVGDITFNTPNFND